MGMCLFLFQLAEDEWEFENIVLDRVSTFDQLSTCTERLLLADYSLLC